MQKELEKIYTERHAAKNAAGGGASLYERERGELFASWVGVGKHVLDIGCRHGAISRYVLEGNKVHGIDIDAQMLAQCPPEMKTAQADLNGDWHVGQENMFDVVIATEVVEHLYYPDVVMEKIKTVLKPGGVFIGTVPNGFSLKNRIRLFLANPKDTSLGEPTHINHFSYTLLKELLERHFSEVVVDGIGQKKWEWFRRLFPGLGSFLLTFKAYK
jgi:2-polyprenyl-3-methyl-5-hydroxy-6-metoxy-1,4-benzoquinol methylase